MCNIGGQTVKTNRSIVPFRAFSIKQKLLCNINQYSEIKIDT